MIPRESRTLTPNKPFADADERQFLDSLGQSALRDFPNPERKDCPGGEFLRTLAVNRSAIPSSDLRVSHIAHCSPCFQELTAFQKTAGQRQLRMKLSFALAAAAVLIIVSSLWLWERSRGGGASQPQVAVDDKSAPILAQISLENRSVARGSAAPSEDGETLRMPRGRLNLTILLPFGSAEGAYDVQILKEIDKPLISQSGQAARADGVTKFVVALNTSGLAAGKYLLGVRHPPLEWAFNPITVE